MCPLTRALDLRTPARPVTLIGYLKDMIVLEGLYRATYLLEAFRDTLHVGYVGQFSLILALRHQIIEFACYISVSVSPTCAQRCFTNRKKFLF